ncbi:hypothetical protein GCM10010309_62000 [Streptomyces violaceochromogenes]|nr:hypothetical protein GCM10010309_62000 [Streptomyces violaceochromogenes]
MSKLSAAKATSGGKVDGTPGESLQPPNEREAMTTHSVTAPRVRTGGPQDDGPKVVEHLMGWALVVVVAMLVTQLGLL